MKLTFYCNACAVIEQDGFRLLCDPWLVPGAFEGAWYHYPPLKVKPQDLADVDALYLSHLHPDHFDRATLAAFRRDIPIVVLESEQNYLSRFLTQMGFTNLIPLKDAESATVGPFEVTMFAPFVGNAFHGTVIGNLLDSAIAVTHDGETILNTNDNTPDIAAAKMLAERFPRVSVAMLNYNAAGPYPSCFNNLSASEKRAEHERILHRNLEHMVAVARTLRPRYVMPFAGAYVIGGKSWQKNAYLGTTTWDDAADHVRKNAPDLTPLVLHEGLTIDLDTGNLVNGPYRPVDVAGQQAYIEKELAWKPYPYETERFPPAKELDALIRAALPQARANLWRKQEKFGVFPDLELYLTSSFGTYAFNFARQEGAFVAADARRAPYLEATLDARMLAKILERREHWNNAEIGCHIEFFREPNVYLPDVHVLLSFLHLPYPQALLPTPTA